MDARDTGDVARDVFAGLTPSESARRFAEAESERAAAAARRVRRGVNLTLPVVLAGAMTVSMNLTAPAPSGDASPRKPLQPRSAFAKATMQRTPAAAAATTTIVPAAAPDRYTVVTEDSVSAIAERFGLSTASVLARNGLGWKSLIFPGQVLTLAGDAAPQPVAAVTPAPTASGSSYTVVSGDTVSGIAQRFGVSTQSVLDANGLTRASVIHPGRHLTIPSASAPAAAGDIVLVADVTPAPASAGPSSSYTIRTGDTISSIAAAFGVPSAAILQANGLGAGSIIYAGRTLTIPGAAAPSPSGNTALTDEMAANARTIIAVGRQLGVPDRGIVIALATAMQESGLRDLPHGDRDSVGIFQQRPSTGWGQPSQLMDVAYAARLFYGGPSNPNAGRTRGLLDIPGWSAMTLTQAAQKVQISAYPDAYAKWEPSAVNWLSQLG